MISRIVPSDAEREAGVFDRQTIEQASRAFRTDGALIIENVVDIALVAETRRAFRERYSHYLEGGQHDDALKVGGRRLLITIKLEPPFDDVQLFANPYLLPILNAAL